MLEYKRLNGLQRCWAAFAIRTSAQLGSRAQACLEPLSNNVHVTVDTLLACSVPSLWPAVMAGIVYRKPLPYAAVYVGFREARRGRTANCAFNRLDTDSI